MKMKPAIVFPFYDPEGAMFLHLVRVTPLLKQIFSAAYLSITSATQTGSPHNISQLEQDSFFNLCFVEKDQPVGKHFKILYEYAAQSSLPKTVLHLGFIDRIAFALQTHHQTQFVEDITNLDAKNVPLIYQRSAKAWRSHPRNYFEAERFVTTIGELVLDQTLDFAWCQLAIQAEQLAQVLPEVDADGFNMMTEMILLLRNQVKTQDVDWLEWEDPFYTTTIAAAALRAKRERSLQETEKRLSYTLPMVQKIMEYGHQHFGKR